jgi:phage terminase small subunit
MPKLENERHELFAVEYSRELNATQSYVTVYNPESESGAASSAIKLLRNAKIQSRIQELLAKRSHKLEISAENVLNSIMKTRARCLQEEPVLDSKGQPTGEYKFDSRGALKADELLGKYLKLWVDRIEIGPSEEMSKILEEARRRNNGEIE